MYGSYLPKVQQRNAILSDYTVGIYGENTSGLNYSIVLDLDQVAGTPASNLVAHLVITESGFPVSWGMVSEANYVCRLMVPNATGTAINFSGSTAIDLSLSFTLDASWDTDELELVAFIQDNSTKEIYQGAKVALDDLQPFQATAYFSSSDTITCETNTVQFYDNSMGNVISWDWTFEGGNPSSSTLENPTVTYDNHGEYDVQLIVSDGVYIDTLLQTNYMLIESVPVQASTPVGPGQTCQGNTFEYTTDPVQYADSYTWVVTPSDAGTISGNGTTGTFVADPDWTGSYTVKVRAENSCGDGVYSNELAAELNYTPAAFQLSQGGGYCPGDPGIELKLYNSETGVDYEIYIDGESTGIVEPGTGDTINFGYQTDEGIYTVFGQTNFCSNEMIGNAWIHETDPPAQAATPTGPADACNDETSAFATTGAQYASTYTWYLDPPEAGTMIPNGKNVSVEWDGTWSGMASLTVEGVNDCGTGPVSNAIEVNVHATPDPVVSGLTLVCNDEEADYSTTDNPGSTYTWTVTGGTIIEGAGTHQITVGWGDPGMGYVSVTEENAWGCSTTTGDYTVTIDDCTGIEELLNGKIRLYPNPSRDLVNISLHFIQETSLKINLLNQLGQVIFSSEQTISSGQQVIRLDISSYPEGYYTIQFFSNDGDFVQEKLVKIR